MEDCKHFKLEGLLEGMSVACCDGFAVYLDRGTPRARVDVMPTECIRATKASVAPFMIGCLGIIFLLATLGCVIWKVVKISRGCRKDVEEDGAERKEEVENDGVEENAV